MGLRANLVVAAIPACAAGLAVGAGPALETAVSVKTHDTGEYGLDLLASTEPRAGGVARLEVTFDAAVDPATVAGHLTIDDEAGTAYPGFTWELEGATLTILPDPPLAEHCFTVDFSGLESMTGQVSEATLRFIALEGDVTGDGITNSIDYSGVKPWYGTAVTEDTFLYDLTLSDPVINAIDGSFVKPRFGNSVSCPEGEGTATELAGDSLAEYPFFDYVRTFNEDATVEVAIDPTRFPDIIGRTCDVHVVAAKTEAEWAGDPSLLDVTPGGPQTREFGGMTIQENTFTVAWPYDLSADAGSSLGVGYDVVLDCDQDGQLGGGDYIDGLADEAGLYVVHDLTLRGPLDTTIEDYDIMLTDFWSKQRLHYPTDIAAMGARPLVMIGHGGGQEYYWYDYLQEHLASYGAVVVSHQNPFSLDGADRGLEWVLYHTDAFFRDLDTIAGGVLAGHVDANRIVWIGHSLGGQAAIAAYDALFQGEYTPLYYDIDGIRLLSAIAPRINAWAAAYPQDAVFHLIWGSHDNAVSGAPDCDHCQAFRYVDRSLATRQSTYIHGAGHEDFNCCGGSYSPLGREKTQQASRPVYLALVKHYCQGSLPARDLLWRQWERIRPIGVDDTTTVVGMYTPGPDSGKRVIDDFQTEVDPNTSSSGGAVSFDVNHLHEGKLDDGNDTLTWTDSDPMNGMTCGEPEDWTRGVVFDWTVGQSRFLEFEVVPGARDFAGFRYLSFRACQGTRHPETVAEYGDLTFTVTLRDAAGTAASIDIGAYGGGIGDPYQRVGEGDGVGWQNEFETIRIRLTDFLTNGSGLDLSDIVAVRFEFGAGHGSARGRVGLDDVELTRD